MTSSARSFIRRTAAAGAVVVGVVIAQPALTSSASAATGDTFTQVSGSPNPQSQGAPFTVTGLQCDRIADVQATGRMLFKDVTTGVVLGKVALGPSSFANCSSASVTDNENLAPGKYKIIAKYLPGGTTPVAKSRKALYKQVISPVTFTNLTWSTGATIPNAHLEGAVVTDGKSIYAISGGTGDCTDGVPTASSSNVDIYHSITNTFTPAAPIPNPRQMNPTALDVNGTIYVIGGTATCGGATVAAVDTYTPSTNTWATLPASSNLPLNGADHCGAAVGSKIYYFEQSGIAVLDTTTSPPSWSVLTAPSALTPSLFCEATATGPDDPTNPNARVIITGPGNGSADANSQRVLVFQPSTGSVTLAPITTAAMAEHSSAVLQGEVVVAGGDFSGRTTVQIIPPGLSSIITATPLPDARDDTSAGTIVGNKMYIVGGESGSSVTPSVLIGTPVP